MICSSVWKRRDDRGPVNVIDARNIVPVWFLRGLRKFQDINVQGHFFLGHFCPRGDLVWYLYRQWQYSTHAIAIVTHVFPHVFCDRRSSPCAHAHESRHEDWVKRGREDEIERETGVRKEERRWRSKEEGERGGWWGWAVGVELLSWYAFTSPFAFPCARALYLLFVHFFFIYAFHSK